MSLVMFRQAIVDLRRTVLWYAIGTAAYAAMILSIFPTLRGNSRQMQDYLDSMPDALIKAFGIADITTLPGFLGAEYLNLVWPIIAAVFAILAGSAVVAREIDQGTVELWLSVPESRARLLWAKLGAVALGIIAIVIATIVTIVLGATLIDETVSASAIIATTGVLAAFTLAIGGYAAFFSSWMSERGKAAGLAAGLTLVFYALWIVASLSNTLHSLRYVSIFSLYDPQTALATGDIPWAKIAVLLVIGVVGAVAAVKIFQRRDAIA
ncbi:MAG TPA: ABC transporter permease subunit [Thermomicrobiales bacterium]|nr:ABC transporter permease subunit [Thermomicrobiales bacterium]